MNYWLFKSEPYKYSWDDMVAHGTDHWDGIRNYQARNNMRQMQVGDLGFFYHSNEGLAVVGIVEVARTTYPDHTFEEEEKFKKTGKNPWEMVDVKAIRPLHHPVTLKAIKANLTLQEMALVKSQRLSVQPVTPAEWAEVLRMAGE